MRYQSMPSRSGRYLAPAHLTWAEIQTFMVQETKRMLLENGQTGVRAAALNFVDTMCVHHLFNEYGRLKFPDHKKDEFVEVLCIKLCDSIIDRGSAELANVFTKALGQMFQQANEVQSAMIVKGQHNK